MKILSESYGYISEETLAYNRAALFDSIFDKADRFARARAKSMSVNEGRFVGNIMFTMDECAAVSDYFAIMESNVRRHLYESVSDRLGCGFDEFSDALNEFGWDDIKNAGRKAADKVKDAAGKAADKLRSIAEKVWELIPEKIRKAMRALAELAKRTISNVRDFIDSLEKMFMSFGGNISEALRNMGGFGDDVEKDMEQATRGEKELLGEAAYASSVVYRSIFEKEMAGEGAKFDMDAFDKEFFSAGIKDGGEAEMYNICQMSLFAKLSKEFGKTGKLDDSAQFDLDKYLLNEGVMSALKDKLDRSGVTAKTAQFMDWASNSRGERPTIEVLMQKMLSPITSSRWFQSFYDSDVWHTPAGKKVSAVLGVFKKILVSAVNSVIYTRALPMVIDGLNGIVRLGVKAGAIASGVGLPIGITLCTAKIVLKWGWITKNVWALYRRQKDSVEANGGKFWTVGFMFQLTLTVALPLLNAFGFPMETLMSKVSDTSVSDDAGIAEKVASAVKGAAGTVLNWMFSIISKLFEYTGLKALTDHVMGFFARALNHMGHAAGDAMNLDVNDVNKALGETFAEYGIDYNELNKGKGEWLSRDKKVDTEGENTNVRGGMKSMRNSSTKELRASIEGQIASEKEIGSGCYLNMRVPGLKGGNAFTRSDEFFRVGTQDATLNAGAEELVKSELGLDIKIHNIAGEGAGDFNVGAVVARMADGSEMSKEAGAKVIDALSRYYESNGMADISGDTFIGKSLTTWVPTEFDVKSFSTDWSWWSGFFKRDKSIRFQFGGQDKKLARFKVYGFTEMSYKDIMKIEDRTEALDALIRMESAHLTTMNNYVAAYAQQLQEQKKRGDLSDKDRRNIDDYLKSLNKVQNIDNHKFFVIELKIGGRIVPGAVFSYATMCGADAYKFTKDEIEEHPDYKDMARKEPYYIKGLFSHIYMKPLEDNDDSSRDDIAKAMMDMVKSSVLYLRNWGNIGIVKDDKTGAYSPDRKLSRAEANQPNPMRGNFSVAEICDLMNSIEKGDRNRVFGYLMNAEGIGADVDDEGYAVQKVIDANTLEKCRNFVEKVVVPFFEEKDSKIAKYYMQHNMNIYKLMYDKDGKFRLREVFLRDPLFTAAFTRPMFAGVHGKDETDYTPMEALFSKKVWDECALSDSSKASDVDKKRFYVLAKRVSEKFWDLYDMDWDKMREPYGLLPAPEGEGMFLLAAPEEKAIVKTEPKEERGVKELPSPSDDMKDGIRKKPKLKDVADVVDVEEVKPDDGKKDDGKKDSKKSDKKGNKNDLLADTKTKKLTASMCTDAKTSRKWFRQEFSMRMNNTNKTLYKKFMEDKALSGTGWLKATSSVKRMDDATPVYKVDTKGLEKQTLLIALIVKFAKIKKLSQRAELKKDEFWEESVPEWMMSKSRKLDEKAARELASTYRRFYDLVSDYVLGDRKMDSKKWKSFLNESYVDMVSRRNGNFRPSYLVSDADVRFLVEDNDNDIMRMYELTSRLRSLGVKASDIADDRRARTLMEMTGMSRDRFYDKMSKYLD